MILILNTRTGQSIFFMIDVLFKFGYRKDYNLFSFLVTHLWLPSLELMWIIQKNLVVVIVVERHLYLHRGEWVS